MSQEPPTKKTRHEEPGGGDADYASPPTPTSIYFDPAAAIVAANAPHFNPHRDLMLPFVTASEDELDDLFTLPLVGSNSDESFTFSGGVSGTGFDDEMLSAAVSDTENSDVSPIPLSTEAVELIQTMIPAAPPAIGANSDLTDSFASSQMITDDDDRFTGVNPTFYEESSLPASRVTELNDVFFRYLQIKEPLPLEMMRNPPPFELGGGGYSRIGRDSYAEEDVV